MMALWAECWAWRILMSFNSEGASDAEHEALDSWIQGGSGGAADARAPEGLG